MAGRLKRKVSNRQRTRQRIRIALLVGSATAVVAAAGFFVWVQVAKPTRTQAEVVKILTEDALPSELKVTALVVAPVDTNTRAGNFKIAKPLNLTPILPGY